MLGAVLVPAVAGAASPTTTTLDAASSARGVRVLTLVLSPGLAVYAFFFLVRIVLSWYPKTNVSRFPWVVAVASTEFLLRPTRRVFPPQGGIDISPIVWLAVTTLARELLLGPQGVLTLMQRGV